MPSSAAGGCFDSGPLQGVAITLRQTSFSFSNVVAVPGGTQTYFGTWNLNDSAGGTGLTMTRTGGNLPTYGPAALSTGGLPCDPSYRRGLNDSDRFDLVGPVLLVLFSALALRLVVSTLRGA